MCPNVSFAYLVMAIFVLTCMLHHLRDDWAITSKNNYFASIYSDVSALSTIENKQ
jgi:hypothetical protein